ncbi:MAG: hypothetical protein HYZ65_14830 [Burkholderiales bacterium]|nr:hypothetical protein [Burkholderiales bacterium]
MTRFSDETLMAYADGELDSQTCREFELALAQDTALAQRLEQQHALRAQVCAGFAGILDEPVPERLLAAAQAQVPAGELAAARAARLREGGKPSANGRRWSWPEWGSMAATLVFGIMLGSIGGLPQLAAWQQAGVVARDAQLLANNRLTQALDTQLASAPAAGEAVHIGLSFRSGAGEYCRSFSLPDRGAQPGAHAGLACRNGDGKWQIAVLMQSPAGQLAGQHYRSAASEMPAALLQAIDERIGGPPLDAQAERAAVLKQWLP